MINSDVFKDEDFDEELEDIVTESESPDTEENYTTVTYGVKTNEFPFEKFRQNAFSISDEDEFETPCDEDVENESEGDSVIINTEGGYSDEPHRDSIVLDEVNQDHLNFTAEELGVEMDYDDYIESEGGIQKDNTSFEYEVESSAEFKETCEETIKVINDTELICKQIGEETLRSLFGKIDEDARLADANATKDSKKLTLGDKENPTVRTFKPSNRAKKKKYKYDKPVETSRTLIQRLLPYIVFCVCISGFFAVKANSCCEYKLQHTINSFSLKSPTASECFFGWITINDMPTVIYPFHPDIFFKVFFIVLAVSAIFAWYFWSKNEERLKARVGHEHGNAKLGTEKDFKKFKAKFMEF